MNAKLTRNGRDVAQGFDNLYYVELGTGDYTVVDKWTRDHNCTNKLCDFMLFEKDGKKILLGSGANMKHWIGREINNVEGMNLNDFAELLEA
jgi:hypothetical protein